MIKSEFHPCLFTWNLSSEQSSRLEAKRQNDLTRRQKIVELSDLHENLEKNLINNR